MVEQEVRKTGSLPADVADAGVQVESNYDPSVIGGVGEIGLMQIRPGTAALAPHHQTGSESAVWRGQRRQGLSRNALAIPRLAKAARRELEGC